MTRVLDVIRVDHADTEVATALLELQRQAYEVEAALIGSGDIPLLTETLDELQSSGETFLAVLVEGRIVGAVSYRLLSDTIDVHRLIVDPSHFRGGIGTALVRAAVSAEPSATRAIAQTGVDNEPAKALYLREGFEQTEELEVAPGLRVARFGKRLR